MSETLLGGDPAPAEATATPGATPAAEPSSLLTPAPAEGESIQTTEGEWLLTPTLKGTGDRPEFMLDKYKDLQSQAAAYPEVQKMLGAFTGAPETYEFTAPEGVDFTFDSGDPLYSKAVEFAKNSNMNQEGFNEMVSMYVSDMVGNQPDAQAEMATRLPEVLGANHAQVIDQVSGSLSNLLDAETYARIAPYCSTPESIAVAQAVILATAPKVPPIDGGTNPSGVTQGKLNEMRSERIADGPNKGELRWHKDADFRNQVRNYAAALHGDG